MGFFPGTQCREVERLETGELQGSCRCGWFLSVKNSQKRSRDRSIVHLSVSEGQGLCFTMFSLSLFPWCLAHGEMGQIQGFFLWAFQNLENRAEGSRQREHRRQAETENRDRHWGAWGNDGPADGLVASGSTSFHFIFIQVWLYFSSPPSTLNVQCPLNPDVWLFKVKNIIAHYPDSSIPHTRKS